MLKKTKKCFRGSLKNFKSKIKFLTKKAVQYEFSLHWVTPGAFYVIIPPTSKQLAFRILVLLDHAECRGHGEAAVVSGQERPGRHKAGPLVEAPGERVVRLHVEELGVRLVQEEAEEERADAPTPL